MYIDFYGLRKFGRFIKRLFIWIPILWKQEDWDYAYIYPLLKQKLQELKKCLKQDDLHVNSNKYAMQISICLEYLDRFLNSDNYIDYPENGFTWDKTERGESVLKTSKEAKRASLKHYNFEQENFRMFWKRFVQWHRNWWC